MYSWPISITVDEQCFLYFLLLDTKTGKSRLYKAQVQKVDVIEKDLTARQVFYSNYHLFLCGFDTDISFVKLKHYSLRTFPKKTLNEYAISIGVSLPQILTYKEMIEKLTVHLEKKKEEYKEKGNEKSKINIVDQGNTKFESIYVIDKNLIFASDFTNERIVTKDYGYGFFALSQLVTPQPQNTEKVKENAYVYRILTCIFFTDSFIIMKPLGQNEDPKIVTDFAAAYYTI